MVIGDGEYKYSVNHHWAQLPGGIQPGYTHGIVEDKDGRIIIANQSKDAILIFNADGSFVKSWGEAYASGAHGLTIHEENGTEYLFLANTGQAEVIKTTLDGEVIWKIATPDLPDVYDDERGFSPTETAIGPDGSVYVADGYGQSWVHRYSSAGEYSQSFGGKGEANGQFACPHGISIDARGSEPYVQVANRSNVRIDNFTLAGEFVETIISGDDLRYPCTTLHADGILYIPDLYCRLSLFDADNKLILHLGDYVDGDTLTDWASVTAVSGLEKYPNIPHENRRDGKFSSPHGMLVDRQRNIYVVEWIDDGRITKLTRT